MTQRVLSSADSIETTQEPWFMLRVNNLVEDYLFKTPFDSGTANLASKKFKNYLDLLHIPYFEDKTLV
jgi:hypothetical protein